jgi:hypothetical protein
MRYDKKYATIKQYTYVYQYIQSQYVCVYIYIHIRLYQYFISENAVYRPKDCHPLNGLRLGTSAIASERDIRWKVLRFKRWLVKFWTIDIHYVFIYILLDGYQISKKQEIYTQFFVFQFSSASYFLSQKIQKKTMAFEDESLEAVPSRARGRGPHQLTVALLAIRGSGRNQRWNVAIE